jgi:hypothetical protein
MTCRWLINPITNPNPRLSHYDTHDNIIMDIEWSGINWLDLARKGTIRGFF